MLTGGSAGGALLLTAQTVAAAQQAKPVVTLDHNVWQMNDGVKYGAEHTKFPGSYQ